MKRDPSTKHYNAPPLPDDAVMPHDEGLESAVLGALLLLEFREVLVLAGLAELQGMVLARVTELAA